VNADFQPPQAFFEFRIVRPLGRGAMGEVFLADDELLGRQVAIKFVRQADRPQMRERFLLEARALARLSHPNVVTVHRVGEVLGRPFIVSEWIQGKSLDLWPLPLEPKLALRVSLQLARALAAAHRAGVLHRDLKPANVLLTESFELKLVDFGVSAALDAAELPPALSRPALAETQPIATEAPSPRALLQVGTPLYAAPELLRGEPGTRLSDIYAFGAVVYEICSGAPPYAAADLETLRAKAEAGVFAPLTSAPPELEGLVRACLSPSPRDRPQRADLILEVLEPLLALQQGPLPEEPYRGLSMFGPEDASLFFGRERDLRAVLERLRERTFVLVAGDSGVGKSSLCRASIVPQLEAGAVDQKPFDVVTVSLGARPVAALVAALRPWLRMAPADEPAAVAAFRSAPEQLAAQVRAVPGQRGRALFVDALEELVSLAPAGDAEMVARFLGALTVRSPSFRFLATARSDFLTRLAGTPSLGGEIGTALYLLGPLTGEALRQAIEGPARAADYRFVPESMVDELAAAANAGPGGLPLVQFALAELWRRRDPVRRSIRWEVLAQMGGVGGALARHADAAVAQLTASQREAAEQILQRLVTPQGTRSRRTRAELPPGEETTQALRALVAARILTSTDSGAQETYELAHEALIQSWGQLRGWLQKDEQKRIVAQRVERAAEEWRRSGAEALWSRKRLRELAAFPALELGEEERRFLAASRAAVRRRTAATVFAAVLLPVALVIVVATLRERAQAQSRQLAAARLREGSEALARARALDAEESAHRAESFARFDRNENAAAEAEWSRVRALVERIERELTHAREAVDSALLLAPAQEAKTLLAELLVFRLTRERKDPLSRDREALLLQLAPFDPTGKLRAPFEAPAKLRVDANATLRPARGSPLQLSPGEEREIKPGSYVVELPGDVRLPILLRFGERKELKLAGERRPPPGFIAVPKGRFLEGFGGDEDVRQGFFNAAPLHERDSGAFAIGQSEVTFAQWMAFLRALPASERARRTPRVPGSLALEETDDGRYRLRLKPTTREYDALEGSPIVYPGRKRNASVDWRLFPVTGISFEDALAYAKWLSDTGRVPGARLCREEEWERAARGADGRSFPGGETLAPDDADIDVTYGREPLAFGPDPAGLHPRSTSPIGAVDMAGNAWEMVIASSGGVGIRGGSWYQGRLTARSVNREGFEPAARALLVGLRLCADEQ